MIPVWCPQNSLVLIGCLFHENMVHWADKRSEMLMWRTEGGLGAVEEHLRVMRTHEVVQTFLDKNPPGALTPIRHVLTFRCIGNHNRECLLRGSKGVPVPWELGLAGLRAQP